jgi:glycosyltransferase involved in cell wall biosynthesis
MHIVHLMASPFLGGPERQVLGLAKALPPEWRTSFLSFAERGLARPFLEQARSEGFEAIELRENFPRLNRAIQEVAEHLRTLGASVLCCSGYKPDLLGWRAARRVGIPVIAIAHGWTGATLKVKLYEAADAQVMRWVDAVVCVSQAMAEKVRDKGIATKKIAIIRNAVDPTPFARHDRKKESRRIVESSFARPPKWIVGACGRLSVEKGFDVLVEAAAVVGRMCDDVGFILYGEGPMRSSLEEQIRRHDLQGRVVLGGFRSDLNTLLPGFDLAALSSHTEGLPVAVLEAHAAGLPVVATAVGGTPEVVLDGVTGYLVPPANPTALAERIVALVNDDSRRVEMGRAAIQRIHDHFTFSTQAAEYQELFTRLVPSRRQSHVLV